MAVLPKINNEFSYIGVVNELPKKGTNGQIVYSTRDSALHAYHEAQWVVLTELNSKPIKEELLEVINKYPNSIIAQDVKNLLDSYSWRAYV